VPELGPWRGLEEGEGGRKGALVAVKKSQRGGDAPRPQEKVEEDRNGRLQCVEVFAHP